MKIIKKAISNNNINIIKTNIKDVIYNNINGDFSHGDYITQGGYFFTKHYSLLSSTLKRLIRNSIPNDIKSYANFRITKYTHDCYLNSSYNDNKILDCAIVFLDDDGKFTLNENIINFEKGDCVIFNLNEKHSFKNINNESTLLIFSGIFL